MAEFLTFSKFYTKEEADAFAALLDSNNIIFDAERLRAQLDNIYLGEDSEPRYLVKVQREDFCKSGIAGEKRNGKTDRPCAG